MKPIEFQVTRLNAAADNFRNRVRVVTFTSVIDRPYSGEA